MRISDPEGRVVEFDEASDVYRAWIALTMAAESPERADMIADIDRYLAVVDGGPEAFVAAYRQRIATAEKQIASAEQDIAFAKASIEAIEGGAEVPLKREIRPGYMDIEPTIDGYRNMRKGYQETTDDWQRRDD